MTSGPDAPWVASHPVSMHTPSHSLPPPHHFENLLSRFLRVVLDIETHPHFPAQSGCLLGCVVPDPTVDFGDAQPLANLKGLAAQGASVAGGLKPVVIQNGFPGGGALAVHYFRRRVGFPNIHRTKSSGGDFPADSPPGRRIRAGDGLLVLFAPAREFVSVARNPPHQVRGNESHPGGTSLRAFQCRTPQGAGDQADARGAGRGQQLASSKSRDHSSSSSGRISLPSQNHAPLVWTRTR